MPHAHCPIATHPLARSPIEIALERTADLSVRRSTVRLALIWLLVVLVDFATGPQLTIQSIYLIPLCLTTWCLGRNVGLVSGAVGLAVTVALNGFGDGPSVHPATVPAAIAAWNVGMRILGIIFIILLVAAFRRAFDRERSHARVDPLTGLGNRRSFEIESRMLALAAARDQSVLLVGLLDLDDFKSVNDRHGHAAGDATLRLAATALASAVRPYDVAARIGGDELAFCLAVGDRAAAEQKVAAIHRSVSDALGASDWGTTCSLGATIDPDPSAALARADSAMYAAKSRRKAADDRDGDTASKGAWCLV